MNDINSTIEALLILLSGKRFCGVFATGIAFVHHDIVHKVILDQCEEAPAPGSTISLRIVPKFRSSGAVGSDEMLFWGVKWTLPYHARHGAAMRDSIDRICAASRRLHLAGAENPDFGESGAGVRGLRMLHCKASQ